MNDAGVEERERLLDLGKRLMAWRRKAVRACKKLAADSSARSTIECVLVDSIDTAIQDLIRAAAWPRVAAAEQEVEAEGAAPVAVLEN